MVDRAFWVPEFRFTDEQRGMLRAELADAVAAPDEFLSVVESRMRIFLAERRNQQQAPVQRPKALRESFEGLQALAKQLYERLDGLDPLGDEARISEALYLMRQPADFLQILQQQLGTLQIAADAALNRTPVPVRGRPVKDHDIGFVAEIAVDHERLCGTLPPSSRGCWFCAFIDCLLSDLPGADEGEEPEHYRLVEAAIDRIKAFRQRS